MKTVWKFFCYTQCTDGQSVISYSYLHVVKPPESFQISLWRFFYLVTVSLLYDTIDMRIFVDKQLKESIEIYCNNPRQDPEKFLKVKRKKEIWLQEGDKIEYKKIYG